MTIFICPICKAQSDMEDDIHIMHHLNCPNSRKFIRKPPNFLQSEYSKQVKGYKASRQEHIDNILSKDPTLVKINGTYMIKGPHLTSPEH